MSSLAFASPDIGYDGITTHTISTTPSKTSLLKTSGAKSPLPKSVTLLKLDLSDNVKKVIQKNAIRKIFVKSGSRSLPASVQLGMNNVPVLDQGVHGTCVTFALTAAIDALKGEGDYYSELCSLNLGKHLANNGYSPSGWDGQSIGGVLSRIAEFGMVSKDDQRSQGCGGMTEYPVNEMDNSGPISMEDFHAISTPDYFSGLSVSSNIFDITKWFSRTIPVEQILEQTKLSLWHGNRVVMGVLLPATMENVGALGTFHARNDAWVLTGQIEQSAKLFLMEFSQWGGHAMVITGYDDNAVAIDNEGHIHKGLFTLRNSWGPEVGDKGTFYMSYDYFSVLAIELHELIKVSL